MPPSLPVVTGAQAVRALERLGFTLVRRRGSSGCVVPLHRELKLGTLSGLLKQAGVSPEEFMRAL